MHLKLYIKEEDDIANLESPCACSGSLKVPSMLLILRKTLFWNHVCPYHISDSIRVYDNSHTLSTHLMIHTMEEGTMRSSYLKRLAM